MRAASSVGSLPGRDSRKGASPNRFVRRLHPAESACERRDDRPCLLDVFVRTGGLRLPEGLLLGEEAHRAFLGESGLSEDLRLLPGEEPRVGATRLRASYRSSSMRGELNRQVCRALVELGASSVAVVSQDTARGRLGSIPEVENAVLDAWLSPEGLSRQVEAASRGDEVPTWPVLILAENRVASSPEGSPAPGKNTQNE